ncbi:MerR family transcriptional regulator [Actinomadura sp. 9N407]|uniref:MerR family transcriptional regulator n=1 Tax=Actinomadura sp. 9N407 TaxID=3375154 RepID=UPI0037B5FEB9
MESTWTIAELAERAVAALTAGESVRVNGRVRDLPNERLIRWYTTIGLVDPPLGRRGRTALYGARHLLQIVAVKRRQAAGRTIAEIQAELAGATDTRLGEIARLPDEAVPSPAPPRAAAPPRTERDRFWTPRPSTPPAPAAQAAPEPPTAGPTAAAAPTVRSRGAAPRAAAPDSRASLVQGVRLGPELTVLLDVPALDADDIAAVETAARPLLEELRRRGLTQRPDPDDTVPPPPIDIESAEPPGRSQ